MGSRILSEPHVSTSGISAPRTVRLVCNSDPEASGAFKHCGETTGHFLSQRLGTLHRLSLGGVAVTIAKVRQLALACVLCAGTVFAQTSEVEDLQNQLRDFEQSSERTIAELKAQIAALEQAHKASAATPVSTVVSENGKVPVVNA